MKLFSRISLVALFTHLTLGLFASSYASASIVNVPNLKVRVFSTDNFSAYLILEGLGTKVIVTCNDDPSQAQSLIHIVQNTSSAVSSTLFSGTDFYCYGALALAKELNLGDSGSLMVQTQMTPQGELVISAEFRLLNRNQLNRFDHIMTQSTNWYKR